MQYYSKSWKSSMEFRYFVWHPIENPRCISYKGSRVWIEDLAVYGIAGVGVHATLASFFYLPIALHIVYRQGKIYKNPLGVHIARSFRTSEIQVKRVKSTKDWRTLTIVSDEHNSIGRNQKKKKKREKAIHSSDIFRSKENWIERVLWIDASPWMDGPNETVQKPALHAVHGLYIIYRFFFNQTRSDSRNV